MLVVTHPGSAHRDEFLACCLLAADAQVDLIERRDPTAEELSNPEILVVDIGGEHEPRSSNFDHHQLPREHEPTCSITLILPRLGVDSAVAREVWKWLAFSELLDSKGPFQTAKAYGVAPDAFVEWMSPIEASVLHWFGEESRITWGTPLFDLMFQIGKDKLEYLSAITERMARLKTETRHIQPMEGVGVWLDVRAIPADEQPVLGLEAFIRSEKLDVPVTITNSDRGGEGLALFRRNDDPRVDFSRLEGREEVLFAHKGGFIAKTRPDADPVALIQAAWTAD